MNETIAQRVTTIERRLHRIEQRLDLKPLEDPQFQVYDNPTHDSPARAQDIPMARPIPTAELANPHVERAKPSRWYAGAVLEHHRRSNFAWLSTVSGVDVFVSRDVLEEAGVTVLLPGQRVRFRAAKKVNGQVTATALELA